MRGIVVADQMQRPIGRRLAIDLTQELQPFTVSLPRLTLRDHAAIEHVQSRKQCGRAVALVVVGYRCRGALLRRQAGLRAIQCLNLTLFIAAQHQRMLRRTQIQPDDVFELRDEIQITRHLETLDPMRLQTIGSPHPPDRRGAHTSRRQAAGIPMSGIAGCRLRRQAQNLPDIGRPLTTAARKITGNPSTPVSA
jgi:hypothetical protein